MAGCPPNRPSSSASTAAVASSSTSGGRACPGSANSGGGASGGPGWRSAGRWSAAGATDSRKTVPRSAAPASPPAAAHARSSRLSSATSPRRHGDRRRRWSLRSLGRNLSVIAQARDVADRGPYRWIRHPLYAGEIASSLGLTVVAHSLAAIAVWLGIVCAAGYRAVREEQLLLAVLPGYGAYRIRTAALLPGILNPSWRQARRGLTGLSGRGVIAATLVAKMLWKRAYQGRWADGLPHRSHACYHRGDRT